LPSLAENCDLDLELVQMLQAGDDQALKGLMDRHRDALFHFVLQQVPNEADALELTIETFVRAYFKIEKFRPEAKFATWLYQIALNLCRDHLKSQAYQCSLRTVSFDAFSKEGEEPDPLTGSEQKPDRKTDRLEELIVLQKAISELPEDIKNVFILTVLEGRHHADTAKLLGISLKAVETRIYRARRYLLKKIAKMGF